MNGKDLFLSLSYVGGDLIEEAARDALSPKASENGGRYAAKQTYKKPFFVAALIALMLLLVGCAAVYVLHLQDMKIAEEPGMKKFDAIGKAIDPTEVTFEIFTPHGVADSPSSLATKEWLDFLDTYDSDRALMPNENENGIPDNYYLTYGCYTWDMVNQLDEIVQKYDLKLLDKFTVAQSWQKEVMYESLGISGVTRPEAEVTIENSAGFFYPNGNFRSDMDFTLTGKDALWTTPCFTNFYYAKKDTFDPMTSSVMADQFDQWQYTTADGANVLLVRSNDGKGQILADVGDATIFIRLDHEIHFAQDDSELPTKEALEQMADIFDYRLSPKTFTLSEIQPKLDAAQAAYDAAQPVCEDLVYTNYGDFLNTQMWLETLYYALYDLNSDGVDELLLGSGDGSFKESYTITNGSVQPYLGGHSRYWICEDNIVEANGLDPLDNDKVNYQFFSGKDLAHIDSDAVTYYHGVWTVDLYGDVASDGREVSEEEARAVLAKHPHIPIEYHSALDYPMNGTTLGQYIRVNDPIRTKEDLHRLYYEFAIQHYPDGWYTLRDVNGDGQEELLVRPDQDSEVNAYTAYRGKVVCIFSGYPCENNVYLETNERWDFELGQIRKYFFYQLEGVKSVFQDRLIYNLSSETWSVDRESPVLSESEAQAILDKYPQIELNMKPICELEK